MTPAGHKMELAAPKVKDAALLLMNAERTAVPEAAASTSGAVYDQRASFLLAARALPEASSKISQHDLLVSDRARLSLGNWRRPASGVRGESKGLSGESGIEFVAPGGEVTGINPISAYS